MAYRQERPREPVSRVLCPTGLGGGHLSRAAVTRRLVRPTRELEDEQPSGARPGLSRQSPRSHAWPCSWWGLPGRPCRHAAGGLLRHLFTLARRETQGLSRWRSVSVALSVGRPTWGLPSTALCGARTFLTLRYGRAQPPGSLGQAHLSTQVVSRQEVLLRRDLGYLGENRMQERVPT